MEIFNAIGLEIPKEKTLSDLAEDAEIRGEASHSARSGGVIHGRCWRIGLGLEVWTILNESETGEVFYADCRPGFRARYTQTIGDWALYEDEDGGTAVEGRIARRRDKIFFQLQNLTEISADSFERKKLTVGLCGLAYRAEVLETPEISMLQSLRKAGENSQPGKSDWHLRGRVIKFNALRNPFSGNDLCWLYLDLDDFKLEILINRDALQGNELRVGASVKADVWLQGHIIKQSPFHSGYEGVDRSLNTVDFWKNYRKLN